MHSDSPSTIVIIVIVGVRHWQSKSSSAIAISKAMKQLAIREIRISKW